MCEWHLFIFRLACAVFLTRSLEFSFSAGCCLILALSLSLVYLFPFYLSRVSFSVTVVSLCTNFLFVIYRSPTHFLTYHTGLIANGIFLLRPSYFFSSCCLVVSSPSLSLVFVVVAFIRVSLLLYCTSTLVDGGYRSCTSLVVDVVRIALWRSLFFLEDAVGIHGILVVVVVVVFF